MSHVVVTPGGNKVTSTKEARAVARAKKAKALSASLLKTPGVVGTGTKSGHRTKNKSTGKASATAAMLAAKDEELRSLRERLMAEKEEAVRKASEEAEKRARDEAERAARREAEVAAEAAEARQAELEAKLSELSSEAKEAAERELQAIKEQQEAKAEAERLENEEKKRKEVRQKEIDEIVAKNREATEQLAAEAERREAEALEKLEKMQRMIEEAEAARQEAIRAAAEEAEQKRIAEETALAEANRAKAEIEAQEEEASRQLEEMKARLAREEQEKVAAQMEEMQEKLEKMARMKAEAEARATEEAAKKAAEVAEAQQKEAALKAERLRIEEEAQRHVAKMEAKLEAAQKAKEMAEQLAAEQAAAAAQAKADEAANELRQAANEAAEKEAQVKRQQAQEELAALEAQKLAILEEKERKADAERQRLEAELALAEMEQIDTESAAAAVAAETEAVMVADTKTVDITEDTQPVNSVEGVGKVLDDNDGFWAKMDILREQYVNDALQDWVDDNPDCENPEQDSEWLEEKACILEEFVDTIQKPAVAKHASLTPKSQRRHLSAEASAVSTKRRFSAAIVAAAAGAELIESKESTDSKSQVSVHTLDDVTEDPDEEVERQSEDTRGDESTDRSLTGADAGIELQPHVNEVNDSIEPTYASKDAEYDAVISKLEMLEHQYVEDALAEWKEDNEGLEPEGNPDWEEEKASVIVEFNDTVRQPALERHNLVNVHTQRQNENAAIESTSAELETPTQESRKSDRETRAKAQIESLRQKHQKKKAPPAVAPRNLPERVGE